MILGTTLNERESIQCVCVCEVGLTYCKHRLTDWLGNLHVHTIIGRTSEEE